MTFDFAEHLRRYGPNAGGPAPTAADAQAYTRQLARAHYENFPVLSVFVPRALRQHFANVYAYCRWSDDLGDEVGDPQQSLELFGWWENELDRCYRGQGRHPVMLALAETVAEFAIPKQPFLDLLSAFRQDQTKTRYADFDELRDYCRRSADPVGRLVLYLCRRFSEENAGLSDSICTGLQLANFWQDVAVDLDKGRIYLPADDRARFGVTEDGLLAKRCTPEFRRLLEFEVARAERFLRDGLPLARRMPGRLRIVIALFAKGGLGILRKIRRADFDVLSRRPKLSKWDMVRAALI